MDSRISGGVAGLVAITAEAGYVPLMASVLIGAGGGVVCYGLVLFRIRKGLDESLDAWAIHGIGGPWGTLATGIFAAAAVNGVSGPFEGNVHQFVANTAGAFAALIYAFIVTYILAVIIDRTLGLRVTAEEEYVGLNISQHGERC
jgi:Amt family ammonium transporter